MVLKSVAATVAILISSATFSAVTLSVPDEIKILAVNDKEVAGNFLKSKDKFKIDIGVNTISMRYQDYYSHADNSHDILKSGVLTLKSPSLQDGQSYRLALINSPKDFEAAKNYKDQPVIGLYDQNNKLLVKQEGTRNQKSWLTTVFSDSNDDMKAKATSDSQPAPVYYVETPKAPQVNSSLAVSQEQQLIQSWKKASKIERQKFMTWLAEQSN